MTAESFERFDDPAGRAYAGVMAFVALCMAALVLSFTVGAYFAGRN